MKVSRRLLFISILVLLLIPGIAFSQVVRLEKLEKLELVRKDITFPELTNEEKALIAGQANTFVKDLYVHRFVKMEYYDDHEDPVTQMAEVMENLDAMSSKEMQIALYKIFAAQRDLHFNFHFPAPHKNYQSFLPMTFTRTKGGENFFQVRVNSVNAEQLEEFAPGMRIPEVGDELMIYNNQPVLKAIRERMPLSMGANLYGGFNRSMDMLAYLNHARYLVPEENEVKMVFRSYKHRRDVYTITVPWIASRSGAGARSMQRSFEEENKEKNPFKILDLGIDDWQQKYNDFLKRNGLEPQSAFPNTPSNEPTLSWGIIDNKYGTFGYLRLASFVPNRGVDFAVSEVRRLLLEELSETDGLIFDVRNNGGGYISLADQLSQLFMPTDATVLQSRLLNTDLNHKIFNETPLGDILQPEWREVINEVHGSERTYSNGAVFTHSDKANELGQAYYKPVGVLTNARSYSSTDMFSSAMQDNRAGIIFGEDPTTGAGGANVMRHVDFSNWAPTLFEALPYGQAMRVSWRQTMRFGENEGNIIEDFGCYADRHVSQSVKDVISGGDRQIKKITRVLAKQSRKYRSYARGLQNNFELYLSKDDLKYGIYVNNTSIVNVLINGKLHETIPAYAYGQESFIEVEFPSDLGVGEANAITFQGVSRKGKILWNLKRRIIIMGESVLLGDTPFSIDFAQAETIDPLTIVNNNDPRDGWNLVSPYLELGYTPNYKDYVDSDAAVMFDMTNKNQATLSFGLEYDTEQDWDFITVYVTSNDVQKTLLRGSGYSEMSTYSYDLSEFAGQDKVVVHFRFTSDSNTNAPGVKLSDISVE